ncbi:MAG: hypothetical protein LBN19_02050 [Endomicrobium sp.]|jgi:hypothetical protein|nr:hypothetical protein [Endomicrobium sp.]
MTKGKLTGAAASHTYPSPPHRLQRVILFPLSAVKFSAAKDFGITMSTPEYLKNLYF